ncbi:MAG: mannitol dehydrogenase family protein [Rhizobiaceae bacterium]
MARARLSTIGGYGGSAALPGYDPADHGIGIVHFGVGAFHRAHQAAFTDDALAAAGGDWRIAGVSLRGTAVADALNQQDGLYTLIERDGANARGRIVASIAHVIAATRDRRAPLEALLSPGVRVVTLSVTEKAYGIDRAAMTADVNHPAVAADLANPANPAGVLGLLVEALRLRKERGLPAFSVLCCDNLPDTGSLLRAGVVGFARHTDPALADWIASDVAFPASMVDRITPAPTQRTLDDAAMLASANDLAAVETEPFRQWVIEDRFSAGRPAWEAGGALFVSNVRPYEQLKLRILNGAHSLIAYAGFLAGHTYVRDAMADPALATLVTRHVHAARLTLPDLPGIDLSRYCEDILARFRNPAIAHETSQIAMDGTQKLPQRILLPAKEALQTSEDWQPFAFATAAWMRYCLGRHDDHTTYELRDPREAEIRTAIRGLRNAGDISDALYALPGLFDATLRSNRDWRSAVAVRLHKMLENGMAAAIADEASAASWLPH